jgi:hypothetical protein
VLPFQRQNALLFEAFPNPHHMLLCFPFKERGKMGWRLRKNLRRGHVRAAPGGGAWRAFVKKSLAGRKGAATPLTFRELAGKYRRLTAQEKSDFIAEGRDMLLSHRHSSDEARRAAPRPPSIAPQRPDCTADALAIAPVSSDIVLPSAKAEPPEIAQRLRVYADEHREVLQDKTSDFLPGIAFCCGHFDLIWDVWVS